MDGFSTILKNECLGVTRTELLQIGCSGIAREEMEQHPDLALIVLVEVIAGSHPEETTREVPAIGFAVPPEPGGIRTRKAEAPF